MTKSDLLDKIKVLLRKMQDHDTPDDVSNKEELGPLLKDAEELLETVSVLKYLIEEEDMPGEESRPEDVDQEQDDETMPPAHEPAGERSPTLMEEVAEPTVDQEETSETAEINTGAQPENTENGVQDVSTINEAIAPPTGGASVASQLEHARREIQREIDQEDDDFRAISEGSNVSVQELREKAPGDWYITASEAKAMGLIAEVV